jgi:hypothetical protein
MADETNRRIAAAARAQEEKTRLDGARTDARRLVVETLRRYDRSLRASGHAEADLVTLTEPGPSRTARWFRTRTPRSEYIRDSGPDEFEFTWYAVGLALDDRGEVWVVETLKPYAVGTSEASFTPSLAVRVRGRELVTETFEPYLGSPLEFHSLTHDPSFPRSAEDVYRRVTEGWVAMLDGRLRELGASWVD